MGIQIGKLEVGAYATSPTTDIAVKHGDAKILLHFADIEGFCSDLLAADDVCILELAEQSHALARHDAEEVVATVRLLAAKMQAGRRVAESEIVAVPKREADPETVRRWLAEQDALLAAYDAADAADAQRCAA